MGLRARHDAASIASVLLALTVLDAASGAAGAMTPKTARPLMRSARPDFVQTTAAGDRMRELPAVRLRRGAALSPIVVRVHADEPRQRIEGIGGSLTEASAHVLAQLPQARRDSVLDLFFGPTGADLTMARTHVGSCDFTVAGRYSYAEAAGDTTLERFSIAPDLAGFAGARDSTYDVLPLIHDAMLRRPGLKLIASPWTAPPWMKDNGDYYTKGRRGGRLLPQHHATFARYMRRYVDAYAAAGVPVWGVTPVNEPLGVGGQWESMDMSAEELRDYIAGSLGPALSGTGVRILQYDQNRDAQAMRYARAALGDPECAKYVWGTAVHWYSATNSACTGVLDSLRAFAPDKPVVHSEGCIDGIGSATNSPGGRFLGWREDSWWWREEATDWGWDWASPEEKPNHPRYAPVHRYARDLIDGLAHGLAGWIDWNIVLDSRGGPNHADNRCAAPVMIDTATGTVYETPLLPVIAHVSRYVRPGDQVLRTDAVTPGLDPDDLHAVAVRSSGDGRISVIVLNTSAAPLTYAIQVGARHATVTIPANALQTIRLK